MAPRRRDIWRYPELLPVPANAKRPPLSVGWTPVVDAPRLADAQRDAMDLIESIANDPAFYVA